MITVLRVSSFPTAHNHGMGLHPYQVSFGNPNVRTIFLAPKHPGKPLPSPDHCTLRRCNFLLTPSPKKGSLLLKLYFHFKRIVSIIGFSVSSLRLFRRYSISIIHIHSPMYLPIAWIGKLLGKKTVLTYHGSDYNAVQKLLFYSFMSSVLSTVFYISPHMKSSLKRLHPNTPLLLTYNGIDTFAYKPIPIPRKKQFLLVGHLKKEKGYHTLIQSVNQLKKCNKLDDYTFLIVGHGYLEEELRATIKELHLVDTIRLLGNKSYTELLQLYSESEYMILASHSEGFPKVVLESIACACTVISTRVGAVKSIFPDRYPLLCQPNNSMELKQKIELAIVSSPSEFQESYSDILLRYSWEKIRNNYISCYQELIGENQ